MGFPGESLVADDNVKNVAGQIGLDWICLTTTHEVDRLYSRLQQETGVEPTVKASIFKSETWG